MYETDDDDYDFKGSCKTELMWPLSIALVVIAVIVGLTINKHEQNEIKIQQVQSGLEECPMYPDGNHFNTIMVKDCEKYVDQFHKYEGKK